MILCSISALSDILTSRQTEIQIIIYAELNKTNTLNKLPLIPHTWHYCISMCATQKLIIIHWQTMNVIHLKCNQTWMSSQ